MRIQKIHIGGWFQRTTLHLTEIWDFLHHAKSNLGFPAAEIARYRRLLAIKSISRENGPLEYLAISTTLGIDYRIYEDGLIILEKKHLALKNDFKEIKDYYDQRLSKTISYIFSKGAPVPKELANIKTILPYIVTISGATHKDIARLFTQFKEEAYSHVSTKNVEVYRGSGIIAINNLKNDKLSREIIETQIFFREFKSQLHRYLAIHRTIWEKIAAIKERGRIKGTEVDALRNELSRYQKTIDLIGSRIAQMGSYVRTRQKMTDIEKVDTYLNPLFQFKFETLLDTHEYIGHLWGMTEKYLASAIEIFGELQAKSTKSTIASLQLVTTIGVVSGLIGYLGRDAWPAFTRTGIIYLAALLAATWLINKIISRFYKRKRYHINGGEIETNIH